MNKIFIKSFLVLMIFLQLLGFLLKITTKNAKKWAFWCKQRLSHKVIFSSLQRSLAFKTNLMFSLSSRRPKRGYFFNLLLGGFFLHCLILRNHRFRLTRIFCRLFSKAIKVSLEKEEHSRQFSFICVFLKKRSVWFQTELSWQFNHRNLWCKSCYT